MTDLHCDLSTAGRAVFGRNLSCAYHPQDHPTLVSRDGRILQYVSNIDYPRMVIGGVRICIAACCPYPYSARTNDLIPPTVFWDEYRKHAQSVEELERDHPETLKIVSHRAEFAASLSEGRIVLIKAIEGLHLPDDPKRGFAILDKLLEDGVAMFGFMWNEPTPLGTPCYAEDDRGITAYGRDVLSVLDERRVIIDISHASVKTAEAILAQVNQATVIATHAGSLRVTPNARNLPEHIARAVSLVGLPFVGPFVRDPQKGSASADDVAAHAADFREVLGSSSRIALGPDFGGTNITSRIPGLDDVASFREPLYRALKGRDFSDEEIAGIFGTNGERLLRQCLPPSPRSGHDPDPDPDRRSV